LILEKIRDSTVMFFIYPPKAPRENPRRRGVIMATREMSKRSPDSPQYF